VNVEHAALESIVDSCLPRLQRHQLAHQAAALAFSAAMRAGLDERLAGEVTPAGWDRYCRAHARAVERFRNATAAERQAWLESLEDVQRHAMPGRRTGPWRRPGGPGVGPIGPYEAP
jgi:hypothetical protein